MAVVAPIVSTWDNRGVKQAESAFGGLTNSAGRSFSKLAGFAKSAALAVGAIGVAAVGAAKVAIDAASDLAEAQSKVDVLFGNSAKAIATFAQTAARQFGLSKQAVYDAAGTFAIFGKAAGLAGDDLATFSTGFVGLAADIASFSNTSPEEAITAIGAALRGEYEPIRKYGVLIDDAALKQKALALGIYKGKGALTAQQKVLAAQALIWEQTTDAQDDFIRTSKGLAGQSKILKAQLANITAEIGQKLLPIAVKIANFINDKVIPAFQDFYEVFKKEGVSGLFKKILDKIQKFGPEIVKKLSDLGDAFALWIIKAIPPAIDALIRFIGSVGKWMVDKGIPLMIQKTKKMGDALVEWIIDAWPKAKDKLDIYEARLLRWITFSLIPTLNKAAGEILQSFVKWTIDLAPTVIKNLTRSDISIAKAIPNLFKKTETASQNEGRKIGDLFKTGTFYALNQLKTQLLQAGANLAASWGPAFRGAVTSAYNAGVNMGKAVINGLSNGVRNLITGAGNLGQVIANAIVAAFKGLWNNYIANPINAAIRNGVALLDRLLGPTINFPTPGNVLPLLANGGIVDSPTLAVIGDRRLSQGKNREAVIPLDKMGGLGGGINITINGAIDPVATARQIRKILATNQNRLGYLAAV